MSEAVAFDLDGTLLRLAVDIDAVRHALAALFAPLGYAGGFAPILERIDAAAAQAAGDDPAARAALRARGRALLDAAELVAAPAAVPVPRAALVVRELARRGYPLGLVTDNGRACVAPALAAAGLEAASFAAIAARDQDGRGKPDPASLLAVAAVLLPAGGRLWYVGDHPRDVEAARAAAAARPDLELRVVGLLGGLARPGELEAAGPDVLLQQLEDLLLLV